MKQVRMMSCPGCRLALPRDGDKPCPLGHCRVCGYYRAKARGRCATHAQHRWRTGRDPDYPTYRRWAERVLIAEALGRPKPEVLAG